VKRRTQNILYHLLPIAFWLLAIGGSIVPVIVLQAMHQSAFSLFSIFSYYLPALLVLIIYYFISRIRRYTNSVEECFWVGLLLGIASYWMPSVLLLTIVIWIWLVALNVFSFRSMLSSLIGMAVVAVWAAVLLILQEQELIHIGMTNSWAEFFAKKSLWAWIPIGAFSIAWFASTIARRNLRVR